MKNYIIINGKSIYMITCNNMDEAKQRTVNICNHSDEIIIREYNYSFDFTINKLK